jgi:hypothetical protein
MADAPLQAAINEFAAGNISAREAVDNMVSAGYQLTYVQWFVDLQFRSGSLKQAQINSLRATIRAASVIDSSSRAAAAGSSTQWVILFISPDPATSNATGNTYTLNDVITTSELSRLKRQGVVVEVLPA